MAAGVEDGIEVLGLDAVEANRRREPRLCVCIGFEPMRKVGLKVWLVALRIERRATPLRRRQHDLHPSVLEREVWRGTLLEPNACLTAGFAELVGRGQNHQDLR